MEAGRSEAKSRGAIGEPAAGDWRDRAGPLIVGGNIGKNKITPNEEAWKDYEICFRALFDEVDYFVVNVSSPNTPGLRELQEKDALRKILTNLQRINGELAAEKGIRPRPWLLKIAPDLSRPQIDDVIGLALEIRLDGLVAANTTISREGLLSSGCPVGSHRGRRTERRAVERKIHGHHPVYPPADGGKDPRHCFGWDLHRRRMQRKK